MHFPGLCVYGVRASGQRILGIYDVIAVGADAIELKHVATGAVRRLALR